MPTFRHMTLRHSLRALYAIAFTTLLLLSATWWAAAANGGAFWEVMQGVCALAATSSLVGSAVFAVAQYTESRHERHLHIYNDLFARLMSESHVNARRWIYQNVRFPENASEQALEQFVDQLTPEQRAEIKLCLNAFDHLGFLVAQGWLDDDKTLGWLNPIVVKTWRCLAPVVELERRRRNEPDYYYHCGYLAVRCTPFDKRGAPTTAREIRWLPKSL